MSTVIDLNALQELQEMFGDSDPEALTMVIDVYLEDSPNLIEQISVAIQEQTPVNLQHAAHTLKSTSATLGAVKLAQICKELEFLGKSNSVEGADVLLTEVKSEYNQVKDELAKILQQG